jgi:hypothetical protein
MDPVWATYTTGKSMWGVKTMLIRRIASVSESKQSYVGVCHKPFIVERLSLCKARREKTLTVETVLPPYI